MTATRTTIALLVCSTVSVFEAAVPHTVRKQRLTRQESGNGLRPSSDRTAVHIGAQGVEDQRLDSISIPQTGNAGSDEDGRGAASSVWMTFHNKHFNPACDDNEFADNLGTKDSLGECLDAVKSSGKGNVGIWQHGLDRNCHVCNLQLRGKATGLSYLDSPHTDTFVEFSGHKALYTNDGTGFMRTAGQWLLECNDLPDTTKFITTTYGTKTDFFKPITNETFCSMLQSNSKHLWSADGEDNSWIQPSYSSSSDAGMRFCGGSEANWPAIVDRSDTREFLGTWCTTLTGEEDEKGGLGSEYGPAEWGQPFAMSFVEEYVACDVFDGSAVSSSYPCECGNTHCSSGEHCARDISECKAPAGSGGELTTTLHTTTTLKGESKEGGSTDTTESEKDGNQDKTLRNEVFDARACPATSFLSAALSVFVMLAELL